MNHINNLQSKRSHLNVGDFEFGTTQLEEVFSHYGQTYELCGWITKREYSTGHSDGEPCFDYDTIFHDLQLYWIDSDDELHEIELSEQEIIELVF